MPPVFSAALGGKSYMWGTGAYMGKSIEPRVNKPVPGLQWHLQSWHWEVQSLEQALAAVPGILVVSSGDFADRAIMTDNTGAVPVLGVRNA